MTAAEALRTAYAAGVRVATDGCDLLLEARTPPPTHVLNVLARHKGELIALLRKAGDGWSAEDWQAYFDERAGIVEFDGGLSREDAEARAFACCVAEWLNRNPVNSATGWCLACGAPGRPHDPLVPFGTEPTGHAYLHHRCWSGWHVGRKSAAIAALATTGIQKGSNR